MKIVPQSRQVTLIFRVTLAFDYAKKRSQRSWNSDKYIKPTVAGLSFASVNPSARDSRPLLRVE